MILAYDLNGAPLPPQHGSPLRLLVPGWYGMTNVKWLARITLVDEPFRGYQQARGYHFRADEDDPGVPLQRIEPRALMVPPGIPEFMTRGRTVDAGRVTIEGRAWSGHAPIEEVDFSADGGSSWAPASSTRTSSAAGRGAAGRYAWAATPGEHVLACRARDAAGNEQPLEPTWNVGGYANNAVQRVPVSVSDDGRALERFEKLGELTADAVELLRLHLQLRLELGLRGLELGLRVLESLDLRLVLFRAHLHLAPLRLDGRGLCGEALCNRVRLVGERGNRIL